MVRLTDFLMFSPRTYNRLFERYNHDVWPLHLAAVGLGIVILVSKRPRLVAVAWLWVAYAFFWERFSTIHTYGKWFAIAFVIEALLCGAAGFSPPNPSGGLKPAAPLFFALILFIYPLIPPRHELFALAPDPTALATLALLPRWPARIIPILWCVFSAATLLAMAMR
ncbi:MAG TPA: hypothetical protein VKB93_28765 [Thermoanaerobaculia bacterium]|nr:hypothetical protein [Thermoanaerobaculia bacterium]